MSRKAELIALLVTFAIAIGGAIILYIGWNDLSDNIASSSWSTTQGVILIAEVERSDRKDSEGRYTYTPRVKYSYQVNGVSYQGDRIGPPTFSTKVEVDARRAIAAYSGGKSVKVYYSPSDPRRAVLEPGFSLGGILIPGFGGCLLLLGAGGFFGFLRGLFTKPKN